MGDNGNPGLNRGSSYHIKKPLKEGVVMGKNKKWIVRIPKNGVYDKKSDAEDHYNRLKLSHD